VGLRGLHRAKGLDRSGRFGYVMTLKREATPGEARISLGTLCLAAAVGFLGVLMWTICAHVIPELILIFSAIVIAEGARPPVSWLERRGIPRSLAILLVLFAVVIALGGLGWLIFAPLVSQLAGLIDDIPHFVATARNALDTYQSFLHDNAQARSLLGQMPARVSTFLESKIGLLIEAPLFLVGLVTNGFLLVLLAFFWLTASQQLAAFTVSVAGPKRGVETRESLNDLSTKIGGYVRGVLINMIVIGMLSFSGVALLGVPYALLLGVVAALTESIPIVGPLLGGSAAVLVASLALGPQKALEVAVLYLVIQQIEGNTLVPYVMNRAVALHPLAIVSALIIGSALLGVPGAILAVPTAAIVQVLILRVVVPSIRAHTST
jgi:predicted PurR-regulated permease PerM